MTRKRRDDEPKGAEALEEISNRLGDVLGGVVGAVGAIEQKLREAAEKGEASGGGESTRETSAGPLKTSWGWRAKVGGLDVSSGAAEAAESAEAFADAAQRRHAEPEHATPDGEAPAPRECLAESFDEPDAWVVTAELPGAQAGEAHAALDDSGLRVWTTGARRFETHVPPPAGLAAAALDADALETRLANGILEVRIPKRSGATTP